jgi:hypothetical protein
MPEKSKLQSLAAAASLLPSRLPEHAYMMIFEHFGNQLSHQEAHKPTARGHLDNMT